LVLFSRNLLLQQQLPLPWQRHQQPLSYPPPFSSRRSPCSSHHSHHSTAVVQRSLPVPPLVQVVLLFLLRNRCCPNTWQICQRALQQLLMLSV
jgi:hypothetical protein